MVAFVVVLHFMQINFLTPNIPSFGGVEANAIAYK